MKEYTFNGRHEVSSSFYQQDKKYQNRSSNLSNLNTKNSYISQTDKKIDQIKRKYDTPNRRQRFSQLGQVSSTKKDSNLNNNMTSNSIHTNNFNEKQNFDQKKSVILTESRNCLKESFAINRLDQNNNLKSKIQERDYLIKQRMQQQYKNQRQSYNHREQRQNLYKNQTEEEFFNRVKKMKQSLFCPDGKRNNSSHLWNGSQNGNQCTRSQYSQYQPNRNSRTFSSSFKDQKNNLISSASNNNTSTQFRPKQIEKDRIDNIDKINQKIKGILECLNQNQKVRATKYGEICNSRDNLDKKSKIYQTQNYRSRQIQRDRQLPSQSQSKNQYVKQISATDSLKKSIQVSHKLMHPKNQIDSSSNYENNFNKILSNHRHKQSQLLQKIQITRPTTLKGKLTVQQKKSSTQKDLQQERWQRISSKLQKYELSNKGRFQKAFNRGHAQNEQQNYRPSQQCKPRQINNVHTNQHNQQVRNAILRKYNRAPNPGISTPAPQKLQRNNLSFFENPSTINNPRTYSVDPKQKDHLRSRSFIGTTEKRDLSVCGRIKTYQYDQLKSGKKLNQQIDKIQFKIQQFQQQKKRLNIQFKPFVYSNSKSAANLSKFKYDLSQRKVSQFGRHLTTQPSQQIKINPVKSPQEQKNKQTFRVNDKQKNNTYNFGGDISFQNRYSQQNKAKLKKSDGSFKNKSQSQINSQKTSKFVSQNSSKVSVNQQDEFQESFVEKTSQDYRNKKNNSSLNIKGPTNQSTKKEFEASGQLRKRTNQGIQDRKRRLMQNTQRREQTEIKELVKILCQQVKFDQQLRNGKLWLQNSSFSNKFEKIRQALSKQSVEKTIQQVEEIFSVSQSQNNPFFTTQEYRCSIQKLCQAYLDSDNHWTDQIVGKFDKIQMQKQGFNSNQIDLEKKGYIQLEDLVRFLNLNSGSFFRNRDVVLIFKRIYKHGSKTLPKNTKIKAQSGKWIDFQWFQNVISKK